jgi:hypothetical protein
MPTPCPCCSADLSPDPFCSSCGLSLAGPEAAELWRVDQRIAEIDRQLAELGNLRRSLWSDHVRLVVTMNGAGPDLPTSSAMRIDIPSPVPAPPLNLAWATVPVTAPCSV